MEFVEFLLRVAAICLTISVFISGLIVHLINHYFDRKELFIDKMLAKIGAGLEAGMKGVESIIKK